MPIYRTVSWLVAGALLVGLARPVEAQSLFQPFLMDDISYYGGPPEPNQGYFFTVEGLDWALSAPETTTVGNNSITPPVVAVLDGSSFRTETNTLNTSWMTSELGWGNRIQTGWTTDHWGLIIGGFGVKPVTQKLDARNIDVVFPDPPFGAGGLGFLNGFVDQNPQDQIDDDINGNGIFGRFFAHDPTMPISATDPRDRLPSTSWDLADAPRLPVLFDSVHIKNRSELWGLEVMPYYRTNATHRGGYFEFGLGVRYLKFFDSFHFLGRGGILNETEANTWASNNIIGPQLGARWFRQVGRVKFSADSRVLLGNNFQSVRQSGEVANQLPFSSTLLPRQNLPLNLNQTSFVRSYHPNEFSPVVELRLGAAYQLTHAIAANIGWTGMYIDGAARASNMVDYVLPGFGINTANNRQNVFFNGINFGLEINR